MKSAPGQVWYWPNTDQVFLILAIRFAEDMDDGRFLFDELDLESGDVHHDVPRSIEEDDRWERLA